MNDHDDYRVAPPRPCVACGQVHGAIGARINCLEAAVVALRGQLTAIRHVFAPEDGELAKLRATIEETQRQWPWHPPGAKAKSEEQR